VIFQRAEREEILTFKGVQPIKINENILRSETAVISAIIDHKLRD
jgi:16S rRNA (uracil1498-N3)-methyltransferase